MNNSLAILYISIVYLAIFAVLFPLIKAVAKMGPFKTIDSFSEKFIPLNYKINFVFYYLLAFCFVSYLLTAVLFLAV